MPRYVLVKKAAEKTAILAPGLSASRKALSAGKESVVSRWLGGVGELGKAAPVPGMRGIREGHNMSPGLGTTRIDRAAARHPNYRIRAGGPGDPIARTFTSGNVGAGPRTAPLSAFKGADQIADELDMTADHYEYLQEAPLPQEDPIELPWLAPGLMYDDGIKIAMVRPSGDIEADNARLCERLVKIASISATPLIGPIGATTVDVAEVLGKVKKHYGPQSIDALRGHFSPPPQGWLANIKETVVSSVTGNKPRHGGPGGPVAQALLAAGVIGGGGLMIRSMLKKRQREQRYANVLGGLQQDPFFENMDQAESKVPEAYEFMRKYAPTLAQDPTVARGFVRHALTSDETYLSHATASALAEAETKHLGAREKKQELDAFIKHPLVMPFTSSKGGGGKKDK